MNWGTGQIIPNLASDYVSVVWTGYLKPTYTESFTFHIESDDGVKVWVNDVLIIDMFTDLTVGNSLIASSAAVALTANELVPIRVEWYDNTGAAFIDLEWSSTSQAKEPIAAARFFTPLTTPVEATVVAESTPYKALSVA